ncbi:hypothetical protein HDU67_000366 [Dinochytrium kinnereticum]|nr:hypothetical protein HDU67_000366 [Dinochytrium kinnereticum]
MAVHSVSKEDELRQKCDRSSSNVTTTIQDVPKVHAQQHEKPLLEGSRTSSPNPPVHVATIEPSQHPVSPVDPTPPADRPTSSPQPTVAVPSQKPSAVELALTSPSSEEAGQADPGIAAESADALENSGDGGGPDLARISTLPRLTTIDIRLPGIPNVADLSDLLELGGPFLVREEGGGLGVGVGGGGASVGVDGGVGIKGVDRVNYLGPLVPLKVKKGSAGDPVKEASSSSSSSSSSSHSSSPSAVVQASSSSSASSSSVGGSSLSARSFQASSSSSSYAPTVGSSSSSYVPTQGSSSSSSSYAPTQGSSSSSSYAPTEGPSSAGWSPAQDSSTMPPSLSSSSSTATIASHSPPPSYSPLDSNNHHASQPTPSDPITSQKPITSPTAYPPFPHQTTDQIVISERGASLCLRGSGYPLLPMPLPHAASTAFPRVLDHHLETFSERNASLRPRNSGHGGVNVYPSHDEVVETFSERGASLQARRVGGRSSASGGLRVGILHPGPSNPPTMQITTTASLEALPPPPPLSPIKRGLTVPGLKNFEFVVEEDGSVPPMPPPVVVVATPVNHHQGLAPPVEALKRGLTVPGMANFEFVDEEAARNAREAGAPPPPSSSSPSSAAAAALPASSSIDTRGGHATTPPTIQTRQLYQCGSRSNPSSPPPPLMKNPGGGGTRSTPSSPVIQSRSDSGFYHRDVSPPLSPTGMQHHQQQQRFANLPYGGGSNTTGFSSSPISASPKMNRPSFTPPTLHYPPPPSFPPPTAIRNNRVNDQTRSNPTSPTLHYPPPPSIPPPQLSSSSNRRRNHPNPSSRMEPIDDPEITGDEQVRDALNKIKRLSLTSPQPPPPSYLTVETTSFLGPVNPLPPVPISAAAEPFVRGGDEWAGEGGLGGVRGVGKRRVEGDASVRAVVPQAQGVHALSLSPRRV